MNLQACRWHRWSASALREANRRQAPLLIRFGAESARGFRPPSLEAARIRRDGLVPVYVNMAWTRKADDKDSQSEARTACAAFFDYLVRGLELSTPARVSDAMRAHAALLPLPAAVPAAVPRAARRALDGPLFDVVVARDGVPLVGCFFPETRDAAARRNERRARRLMRQCAAAALLRGRRRGDDRPLVGNTNLAVTFQQNAKQMFAAPGHLTGPIVDSKTTTAESGGGGGAGDDAQAVMDLLTSDPRAERGRAVSAARSAEVARVLHLRGRLLRRFGAFVLHRIDRRKTLRGHGGGGGGGESGVFNSGGGAAADAADVFVTATDRLELSELRLEVALWLSAWRAARAERPIAAAVPALRRVVLAAARRPAELLTAAEVGRCLPQLAAVAALGTAWAELTDARQRARTDAASGSTPAAAAPPPTSPADAAAAILRRMVEREERAEPGQQRQRNAAADDAALTPAALEAARELSAAVTQAANTVTAAAPSTSISALLAAARAALLARWVRMCGGGVVATPADDAAVTDVRRAVARAVEACGASGPLGIAAAQSFLELAAVAHAMLDPVCDAELRGAVRAAAERFAAPTLLRDAHARNASQLRCSEIEAFVDVFAVQGAKHATSGAVNVAPSISGTRAEGGGGGNADDRGLLGSASRARVHLTSPLGLERLSEDRHGSERAAAVDDVRQPVFVGIPAVAPFATQWTPVSAAGNPVETTIIDVDAEVADGDGASDAADTHSAPPHARVSNSARKSIVDVPDSLVPTATRRWLASLASLVSLSPDDEAELTAGARRLPLFANMIHADANFNHATMAWSAVLLMCAAAPPLHGGSAMTAPLHRLWLHAAHKAFLQSALTPLPVIQSPYPLIADRYARAVCAADTLMRVVEIDDVRCVVVRVWTRRDASTLEVSGCEQFAAAAAWAVVLTAFVPTFVEVAVPTVEAVEDALRAATSPLQRHLPSAQLSKAAGAVMSHARSGSGGGGANTSFVDVTVVVRARVVVGVASTPAGVHRSLMVAVLDLRGG